MHRRNLIATSLLGGEGSVAGTIVGALAAGLYLIPDRGIQGTFLVAASLNALVGLCAVAAGRMVIAAAATFVILISVLLLTALELLRRRNERLRGIRA